MRYVIASALFCFWQLPSVLGQDLTVDHISIHVDNAAPEAVVLTDAGLELDKITGVVQHTGQGTAAQFVRFENVYLELIWVEDEDLLRAAEPDLGDTLLRRANASPFEIGLRHREVDPASMPFETVSYWAEWMRPLVSIAVAKRVSAEQGVPEIFVVPQYMRWDVRTEAEPGLLRRAAHPLGVRAVSRVRVHGPGFPSDSEAVRYLMDNEVVEFVLAESHFLELEFDGRREQRLDLRPTLPLVIYH